MNVVHVRTRHFSARNVFRDNAPSIDGQVIQHGEDFRIIQVLKNLPDQIEVRRRQRVVYDIQALETDVLRSMMRVLYSINFRNNVYAAVLGHKWRDA